jgi:ATP-dependent protease ClpP protease subunit
MITIKLHDVIANEDNRWWYSWDDESGVFSLEFVQKLFEGNPDETDFKFDIHCPGGEVEEGLAIYDYLRTSGKTIHMNIEGACHSMAVCLLLAAPREYRSANPNALALIHKVWGYAYGGTADELEAAAEETRMLQDKILNIYADRTDKTYEELQEIMNKEKQCTAQELLSWGFISKINSYNTNLKQSKTIAMNIKQIKKSANALLNKIGALLGGSYNYEFVDAEGEVLFTTEGDSAELTVGMAASPDGTFVIADGRTVTIAEGVITQIQEASAENHEFTSEDGTVLFTTESESDELTVGMAASPDGEFTLPDGRVVVIAEGVITEIREASADPEEVENLRSENVQLREALSEAQNLIREMKKNIKSNYVPGNRVSSAQSNRGNKQLSREERKSAVKEALKATKK